MSKGLILVPSWHLEGCNCPGGHRELRRGGGAQEGAGGGQMVLEVVSDWSLGHSSRTHKISTQLNNSLRSYRPIAPSPAVASSEPTFPLNAVRLLNRKWKSHKPHSRKVQLNYPMKFITMRWRMTWAKMKSANALSGLIPANWDLLAGFTWDDQIFNIIIITCTLTFLCPL